MDVRLRRRAPGDAQGGDDDGVQLHESDAQRAVLSGGRSRLPDRAGRRGARLEAALARHRGRSHLPGGSLADDVGLAALPRRAEAGAGLPPRHQHGAPALSPAARVSRAGAGPGDAAGRNREGLASFPVAGHDLRARPASGPMVLCRLSAVAHGPQPAGPSLLHVAVHMPGVIPGRAVITVTGSPEVEQVTVQPVVWDAGPDGAPPADPAARNPGSGAFHAELWLMTAGSYGVRVTAAGSRGVGTAVVPVSAAAYRRLGMSRSLAATLLSLAT